ncbi:MAG: hypothetical protein UZ11_BCD004001174 [Bacteroidetes bacterium OLB11]|nr:MAG: hypothetical protein UZ11_BCD004001174 [Bacteroidetes bacterium OLB11]
MIKVKINIEKWQSPIGRIFQCPILLMMTIGIILLFTSCSSHKTENIERAFYYWKSNENLSDIEKEICDTLGINKLYIKFFEVNFNEEQGNFPEAKTNWWGRYSNLNKPTEVVPTVYLRNVVFFEVF